MRRASSFYGTEFFYAHGHPEEECQQKLTGVRRASRGEGHSPTRLHKPVQGKYAAWAEENITPKQCAGDGVRMTENQETENSGKEEENVQTGFCKSKFRGTGTGD